MKTLLSLTILMGFVAIKPVAAAQEIEFTSYVKFCAEAAKSAESDFFIFDDRVFDYLVLGFTDFTELDLKEGQTYLVSGHINTDVEENVSEFQLKVDTATPVKSCRAKQ